MEFTKLLEKAYKMKSRAVAAYRESIRELQRKGLLHPALKNIMTRMLLDSIIHLNIVKAVITSIEEVKQVAEELEKTTEETGSEKPGKEHVEALLKVV